MGVINACIDLRTDDRIAVITIENPPVNALRQEVRAGLLEAFGRIEQDAALDAAVVICAGRTFVAGADITEFGKPPLPPSLPDVIGALEAMRKPVLAAMHGTPLGGGLELALGCHYRIATSGTKLGLPEIKLGLIPGAGGTQRLPRLVGIEKALDMILSGEPIPAREALQTGLVDALAEGDLLTDALAFARRLIAERAPARRVRDSNDKLAVWRGDLAGFDALASRQLRRRAGQHAPAAAVEAIRGALELPMDDALAREREKFLALRDGEQSKAQRHIFFAEREAARVAGMPKNPREIARAAVIGAGTMGGGIAMCFANAGIPVTVVETGAEALERGLGLVRKNYQGSVARGGLAADEMERRIGLIHGTTERDAIADADLVIEAVFEDMDVKTALMASLDRLAKPEAVLATNTSYLDVDRIAQATQRPQAVVGMHFFSPANVMRLLEVVRGADTSLETLATVIAAGRKLGKVPVVVGNCHGFVGNRMLRQRTVQAERLLLEGALPQDVDAALTGFGLPMGPFAMSDLAGLDISWRMRKAQGLRAEIADALCEAGRFGQKTGRGFYRYEAGSRMPVPDPEVEQLIVDTSKRLGIPRRPIGKDEIVERLLFPMINEGARILDERIAQRPGDIDVVWVYGYGWPAWRGGPMFYADSIGLDHIRRRLAAFAAADPSLQPAPLLVRLAEAGQGFASLAK